MKFFLTCFGEGQGWVLFFIRIRGQVLKRDIGSWSADIMANRSFWLVTVVYRPVRHVPGGYKQDRIAQAIVEFLKIFFIQEEFVLFIEKLSLFIVEASFTLRDGQVILIGYRGFDIKKISPFTGPNRS